LFPRHPRGLRCAQAQTSGIHKEPGYAAHIFIGWPPACAGVTMGKQTKILLKISNSGRKTMGYKVAVVGATGNVGHEMMNILAERNFPVDDLVALASSRSVGKEVSFGDDDVKVQDLAKFDFRGVDIVLSSPGAQISAEFSPIAAKAGAVVIDNTSHFRMDEDVPLVVPEVNPQAIAGHTKKGIIANPNCSTIQMVVALKPLHDAAKIKRVVVSTYQSVSGGGKAAMDELFNQTRHFYMNDKVNSEVFPKQISFNVIPQIDKFLDDGSTKEEWKMAVETNKILDPDIKVVANCVRVPVFIGHSEMVNVEFENPLSAKDAMRAWKKAAGLSVIDLDSDLGFVTPAEIAGEDDVFISRVREDKTVPHGLNFWCVSDNLRKGAALNAVQIAEVLVKKYMKMAA
jgi:aspartate-semialdehyde dehydrogenase